MTERAENQDQTQEAPLTPPQQVDSDWEEKIERARQARKMGQEMRRDKAASFRRAVGRAA